VLREAAACTYQSADANNHLPRKPAFFPLAYFARGYWRSWQIGDSNRKREESSAFARSPRSANIHFLERAIRMRAAQILGAIVVAASMVALLSDRGAEAQSDTNLNVLRGLAPLSTLDQTDAGKAVLTREFAVTVAIQNGSAREPTGLQFPDQFIVGVTILAAASLWCGIETQNPP
jgi:hypothetical protein